MALIDIEYGSLASSETMNKNFTYLDDKIAETSESIMTSISSILSNIATINSRLNDITESMDGSMDVLTSSLDDYKNKTKLLVKEASMVPNWTNCVSIGLTKNQSYTVISNGYILLATTTIAEGNISVNGRTVVIKIINGQYDNGSHLLAFPVCKGDVVVPYLEIQNAYFLPVKDIIVEDF